MERSRHHIILVDYPHRKEQQRPPLAPEEDSDSDAISLDSGQQQGVPLAPEDVDSDSDDPASVLPSYSQNINPIYSNWAAARKATQAKSPAVAVTRPQAPHPPPTIAASSRTKTVSRSQSEVSSSTPIDESRSGPRPLNKHADPNSPGGGHEPVRRYASDPVAPQADPDEVILPFPLGKVGGINITNGDLTRLAPGKFLNDNLVELGLRLWLLDLEVENPELAKQTFVFNSFFYKKLDDQTKKMGSLDQGYESVRKWTAKCDVFSKKYLVVPINENLHWYLAIIYQPEYTLPKTQRFAEANQVMDPAGLTCSPTDDEGIFSVFDDETNHGDAEDAADAVWRRPTVFGPLSLGMASKTPSNAGGSRTPAYPEEEVMDVDVNVDDPDPSADPLVVGAHAQPLLEPAKTGNPEGSAKPQAKRRRLETFASTPDAFPLEAGEDEAEDVQPLTYVITLDSLGYPHPRVNTVLCHYLQCEAWDKKKISKERSRKAVGKQARVPLQPNSSDCGIYLLHLVQTFLSDPLYYFNLINSNLNSSLELRVQWKDDRIKTLRRSLTERINKLSAEWKQSSTQKELKTTEDSPCV